jgi:hypothetical protein
MVYALTFIFLIISLAQLRKTSYLVRSNVSLCLFSQGNFKIVRNKTLQSIICRFILVQWPWFRSKQPLRSRLPVLTRFTNTRMGKRRAINLGNFSVNQVVSSISTRDRKILEELVRDCMLYGLSEQESLDYVQKRAAGIRISRSNFYAIKGRISQNEENTLQERLANHSRVGFAVQHFKIIDQIEDLQKILFQTLMEESSKPSKRKNLFAISRVASNILDNAQALRILNIDEPFVAAYKARVDELKEYKRLEEQKIMPRVTRNYPEGALVIDPNTIAGKKLDTPDGLPWGDKPVFE